MALGKAEVAAEEFFRTKLEGYKDAIALLRELAEDGDEDATDQAHVELMEMLGIYRAPLATHWGELTRQQQVQVLEADRELLELDDVIFDLTGVRVSEAIGGIHRSVEDRTRPSDAIAAG